MLENINMNNFISDRISQAIKSSGKSKSQIAREIGVSPQAVTNWTSDGSIDKNNLLKLCEATGTSEKWIISGTDAHNFDKNQLFSEANAQFVARIDPEVAEIIEFALTHQLADYFNKLPPNAQIKLVFALYESTASDKALLHAARDMQPATLLKMAGF